jgi:hypothetical protein
MVFTLESSFCAHQRHGLLIREAGARHLSRAVYSVLLGGGALVFDGLLGGFCAIFD